MVSRSAKWKSWLEDPSGALIRCATNATNRVTHLGGALAISAAKGRIARYGVRFLAGGGSARWDAGPSLANALRRLLSASVAAFNSSESR